MQILLTPRVYLDAFSLPTMRTLYTCAVLFIFIFLIKSELSHASSLAYRKSSGNSEDKTKVINVNININSHLPPASRSDSSSGRSMGNSREQNEGSFIPRVNEEGAADDNTSLSRFKRTLKPHIITKKKEMLFYDKDLGLNESYADLRDYSSPTKLSTIDFIIRLQEKYEYSVCGDYLRSVPDYKNKYFLYDEDLVNIGNDDDPVYKGVDSYEDRLEAQETTKPYRYRLYDEECDEESEWEFWREMFIISENDTEAVPKKANHIPASEQKCSEGDPANCTTTTTTEKPDHRNPFIDANLEEYDYVQVEMKDMMNKWNTIWERFKNKKVCNQQLLLECRKVNETRHLCRCRTNGVGLPTIQLQFPLPEKGTIIEMRSHKPLPFPEGVFTDQYYEDAEENINSETVRHYGKYVHKKKCVVAASVSVGGSEAHIVNPCDYFLPMIGLCTAECHINATCKSVNKQEQDVMAELSSKNQTSKTDYYRRLIDYKLHDAYHSKCVCNPEHTCQKVVNVTYGQATSLKQQHQNVFQNPTLYLTAVLQLIALFINRYFKRDG